MLFHLFAFKLGWNVALQIILSQLWTWKLSVHIKSLVLLAADIVAQKHSLQAVLVKIFCSLWKSLLTSEQESTEAAPWNLQNAFKISSTMKSWKILTHIPHKPSINKLFVLTLDQWLSDMYPFLELLYIHARIWEMRFISWKRRNQSKRHQKPQTIHLCDHTSSLWVQRFYPGNTND